MTSVWVTAIALILIITLFLRYLSKYENNEFKLHSFFLLPFGAFCQQGITYKASLFSTRCLIIFLFLTGLLLCNFYSSVLVSHLVDMKYESKVNTIEDLAESDLEIGLLNSTNIGNYLKVTNASVGGAPNNLPFAF